VSGWGRCRRCRADIWWGTNPYDDSRAFPFDDEDEQQSHFETCEAQEWVEDGEGGRHTVSRCRACNARVWWQTTARGKRRPMDTNGDEATWECHFDTCAGRKAHEPQPEPPPRRPSADPRVAAAPYAIRLWLPDLELTWPTTPAEVTSAFRRLALIHHPDMGGKSSEFIRIKLAYDRLKELLAAVA